MHWILQDNLFNEAAYQTLLDTLVRFNIPHSVHKVIPFIGELTPEPGQLIPCKVDHSGTIKERLDRNGGVECEYGTKGCMAHHENVICMGSYSLRHTAQKEGWYPGVFDLEEQDFTVQLKHWGDQMFNADAVVCRFEDAVFTEDLMFIRPIKDSKVFAGTVMDKAEFEEWQRKVCVLEEDYGNSLTKDTLIQVCKARKIYAEYRFWIVNKQIVTASLYKRGDRVIYSNQVDKHVYDYVYKLLKGAFSSDGERGITLIPTLDGWLPADSFCVDVWETPDGMRVGEIGTINSCGLYAADIPALVHAFENAYNDR